MQIRESIDIPAPASRVWPYLADPLLHANWNPKVVQVDRAEPGPVKHGDKFSTIYRMGSRERPSQVEVIACEPPRHIAFLHRLHAQNREYFAQETYQITERSAGVRVVQTIDMDRAGLPWLARMIIWLISKFGRPVGEQNLARLKRIVLST